MPPIAEFPLEFARALPKAELHVHLEGTVDAATLLALAKRHGVDPPAPDEAGVVAWYRFNGFEQFVERYFFVLSLLRDPEDFAFVAERYLAAAHAQGVVHVEFHVSATGHLVEGGKDWATIQAGIVRGCATAEASTGISWALIPDVSPHLGADASATAMAAVLNARDEHVVAVGMGGPADRWWTDDFSSIYRDAANEGLHPVAHAGEHGSAKEIRFAIEEFGAERIQHGIAAADDPAVMQLLERRAIACDVCPGSNLALGAVASAQAHPLPAMLRAGVPITLGSDDPPMFQTTLLDEYRRAWDWCGLDPEGLRQLADNSLRHSFAPGQRVTEWVSRLGAVAFSRPD